MIQMCTCEDERMPCWQHTQPGPRQLKPCSMELTHERTLVYTHASAHAPTTPRLLVQGSLSLLTGQEKPQQTADAQISTQKYSTLVHTLACVCSQRMPGPMNPCQHHPARRDAASVERRVPPGIASPAAQPACAATPAAARPALRTAAHPARSRAASAQTALLHALVDTR